MSDDLCRLVYYSHNRIPGGRQKLAEEVAHILATSQTNNVRSDITGALIFNSGVFAQVLEGPRRAVERTLETIQRDTRHGDVQVLYLDAVEKRVFPSWSMAYVGRSREDQDLFGRLGEMSGFEERHLTGERIFEIIRQIAEEEELLAA